VRPFTSASVRSRQRLTTACSAEPQAAKQEKAAGRMTYRPESYAELVQDATKSVMAAIQDGINLMEVEFPAVPANIDGEYRQRQTVSCMQPTASLHQCASYSSCDSNSKSEKVPFVMNCSVQEQLRPVC
jgi:hypothetical protein